MMTGDAIGRRMAQGKAAAWAGDFATARDCFRAVIERDPQNVEAWLWLAGSAEDSDRSLACLRRVLEIDPNNQRARAGVVWAEERRQRRMASMQSPDRDEIQTPIDVLPSSPISRPSSLPFPVPAEDAGVQRQAASTGLAILTALTFVAVLLAVAVLGGLYLWGLGATPPVLAESKADVPTAQEAVTADPATVDAPALTIATAQTPTYTVTPAGTVIPTETPTPVVPTAAPTALVSPTLTVAATVQPIATMTVIPVAHADKWIDIALDTQTLTAFEGSNPVFQTLISSGLPRTPTVRGTYRIYHKLTSTTMSGPDYYLPNVLYTQYFYKGYALHGTYWHDNFGQPMSHGCVNLRDEDARWLFEWTEPALPDGVKSLLAADHNPGTLVVVH